MFFKTKQKVRHFVVVAVGQSRCLVVFLLRVMQWSFLQSFIGFGPVVSEMF